MKIYKYQLNPSPGSIVTNLPMGFKVLDIQVQGDTPVMWCLVNPSSKDTRVEIETVYTGTEIRDRKRRDYLGTYQLDGLVYHIFLVE